MKTFFLLFINMLIISSALFPLSNNNESNNHIENYFNEYSTLKNNIVLLKSGLEALNMKLKLIEKAEISIYIETFMFHNDSFGSVISDALIKKSNEGVEIKIIYDTFGSIPYVFTDFFHNLENNGVELIAYNDFINLGIFNYTNNWHRKLFIVDSKYAIIGGMNINENSIGAEINLFNVIQGKITPPERDTSVYLEGEIVYKLYKEFINYWYNLEGKIIEEIPINYSNLSLKDYRIISFSQNPIWENNIMEDLYYKLISNSKKYILIETAYLLPSSKIIDALIDASKRNVNISILISSREFHNEAFYYDFSVPILKKLQDYGINIYSFKESNLHSKIAVFDGIYSIVGSTNLDLLSLIVNSESAILIESEKFAKELENWIKIGIENSKKTNLEELYTIYNSYKLYFYIYNIIEKILIQRNSFF